MDATAIKYNEPFEVTEKQYKALMKEADGIVAGQIKDGKHYIKIWLMKYKDFVIEVINTNS